MHNHFQDSGPNAWNTLFDALASLATRIPTIIKRSQKAEKAS